MEAAIRMSAAAILLFLAEYFGKRLRKLEFDDMARCVGGRLVPNPGGLSRLVVFGISDYRRDVAQLRPSLGHALRVPDVCAGDAGSRRL